MAHYGTTPTLAVFFLASLILALTPGPGVIYLVTRALGQGPKAGLASVAGVALGNLANACLACLGLGAILAVSSRAFAVVKLAGAAYLLWLGARALQRAPAVPAPSSSHRVLRDGVWVALLNPKTAVFYAAFLPQFIDANGPAPLLSALSLATLFVVTAVCTDSLYVLAASNLRARIRPETLGAVSGPVSGLVYLALGTFLAFSDARPSR